VKVKIIKINHETHRISLGMKQLLDDPWQGIEAKFPVGTRFKGRVTNITTTARSWSLSRHRGPDPRLRNVVDQEERSPRQNRLHLAGGRSPDSRGRSGQAPHLARTEADHAQPVGGLRREVPAGTTIEGEVKNKTEFGLFLGLDGEVDGMVHLSDLDWKRPGEQVIEEYKKGDKVQAQVLDVDVEKERISLGIKQLQGDPMAQAGDLKKGDVVTTEVTEVKEAGIDVKIAGGDLTGLIKRSELARDRNDQRADRFQVGQKVDARVVSFDRRGGKAQLSIRRWRSRKRRRPSPSTAPPTPGATLGDILGSALKRKDAEDKE